MALVENGRCEYTDLITSQEYKSQIGVATKVTQMLDTLCKYGEDVYNRNDKQMKHVGDGMWELKPVDHRLLMFQQGADWIIVKAFKKPKGQKKVQSRWINDAKTTMQEYLTSLSQ